MGSTLEVLGHQFWETRCIRNEFREYYFNGVGNHQIGMEFAPIFQLVVVVISFFVARDQITSAA